MTRKDMYCRRIKKVESRHVKRQRDQGTFTEKGVFNSVLEGVLHSVNKILETYLDTQLFG